MATIINSIGTSSRDYSTIAAWIASLPADIVASGNSYVGQCYNDSEFATTANITFSGHTTDATHTITLTTGSGQSFRDNVNVQTNRLDYVVTNGVGIRLTVDSDWVIGIADQYVTLSNLQIFNNSGFDFAIDIGAGFSGVHNTRITNCIIKSDGGSVIINRDSGTILDNCVLIKTSVGEFDFAFQGWGHNAYSITVVYPSDASTLGEIIWNYGDSSTWENSAFFGGSVFSSHDLSAVTFTTCATDLSSPASGVTGSFVYANQFQNTTTALGDWRLKSGSGLIGIGTTETTYGSTDIAGTSRPQVATYDIGAWEFASGVGATLLGAQVW